MTPEEHLEEIREYARQHTMLKVPGDSPTMKPTAHSPQPPANEPLRLFAILSLLVSILFLASGCGTVAAFKQPFVVRTNTVPTVITIPAQTNTVARIVEGRTNRVGKVVTITPAFVTNIVTITPPAYVTNWSTNILYEVTPGVQSALATLETVNKFNPTPSAPIIDLVLAGIAAGFAWFSRLKTKQAATNAGIAQTLVMGIEEAQSTETKEAVAKLSAKLGNAPAVNELVQKVTLRFA